MRLAVLTLLAAVAILATPVLAQQAATDPTAAITAVLDDSAVAWSHGDLDEFMDSYERGDDVTFIGRDGPVKGWTVIRDRYRQAYGGTAPDAFGQLGFDVLEVRPLDVDDALVTGRYHLERDGKTEGGVFTLLFHHGAAGWRIAYDHTS